MGKVVRFLTAEQRRVVKVLEVMEEYELKSMIKMLPGGYSFTTWRFGTTQLNITGAHHKLVEEELERRRERQSIEVS